MTEITLLLVHVSALAITLLFLLGAWEVLRSDNLKARVRAVLDALGLKRVDHNPILSRTNYAWEAEAVMNPAAVEAGDRTHLFYRAIGNDGVSRIGYASSENGTHFDERLPYPVFALTNAHRQPASARSRMEKEHPELVASGGSWAGCEDPRAVVIEDRVYLSFNAFSDWGSLRIGVTSLSLPDLMKKRWNWKRPVFLSPPNTVQKNWVLFPKKINGKFAMFQGLEFQNRDKAQIAYLDTLEREPAEYLDSDARFRNNESYSAVWDSRIRGAAAPPIETPYGWLMLYHANDAREPERYKIGAMLLDLLDPSKVLLRSPAPILEPDAHYENDGKPGIVYACGATVRDGQLRVYYGGGDKTVCTASTPLASFMKTLLSNKTPQLKLA